MNQLLLALLCALTLSTTACASQSGPAQFTVTPDNPADKITVRVIGDTARFDIVSPTGIGKAQIKRAGGSVPRRIEFVIHTRGLENFTLLDPTRQQQVNVPSGDGPVEVFVGPRDGELGEHTAVVDEPGYMEVKIFGPSQSRPLPDDGYFQVLAPPGLLQQGANEFSISWIDFYR